MTNFHIDILTLDREIFSGEVTSVTLPGVEGVFTALAKHMAFVTPLTFQSLTNHPVYLDMWQTYNKEEVEHISLAQWADIMIISPATANIIGKIAQGIADNLLTTVVMALPKETPVLIAPAMNTNMWENPLVQKNIDTLKNDKKYLFMETREGVLACRDEGSGKIAGNEDILKEAKKILLKK